VLLYAPSLPSTQTLLFKQLDCEQDGIVCVVDRQVSGRGRGDNRWESPAGCLTFSFSTSVQQPALLPFFQYVVSMALYKTVSAITKDDAKASVGLQLKWPNDIYGPNKAKIGGVLCESRVKVSNRGAGKGPSFYVIAGVGINLFNSQPTTCLRDMLAEAGHEEAAEQLTREGFLAQFCGEFEALLSVLRQQGFAPLTERYTDMWMHTGQSVKVQDEKGGPGSARQATIRGVAPSGFLLAQDDAGTMLELHPDGNSLDMMKGLISRKVPRMR